MKLFKSQQIRQIDKYTIENEPISSINLMERAATAIFNDIVNEFDKSYEFCVIAGPGNNGGDGLVNARLLLDAGYNVSAYLCKFTDSISPDCKTNYDRLINIYPESVNEICKSADLEISENTIIIDAIFGSGLARVVGGEFKKVIDKINNSNNVILSIDIPSGLFGEDNSKNNGAIVKANKTFALEFPSISMMFAENSHFSGNVIIVPIGLSVDAINNTYSDFYVIDSEIIHENFNVRGRFEHKGNFGHLLLIAGSYGKAGAAVLAAKAAVKSGSGLVTAHLPAKLVDIMQISIPEVMISIDRHTEYCSGVENLFKYDTIGIGPGLDTKNVSKQLLLNLLKMVKIPIILDADALNILSNILNFVDLLPSGTIITPHPKEFERLFGKFENTWQKIEFMKKISVEKSIIIVLKGGITCITIPDGRVFFNTAGNPGMATGGSGDVLTGVIASLLAQGYNPEVAAVLGVNFHARAGDLAKQKHGEMALIASDIIDSLGYAFNEFEILKG